MDQTTKQQQPLVRLTRHARQRARERGLNVEYALRIVLEYAQEIVNRVPVKGHVALKGRPVVPVVVRERPGVLVIATVLKQGQRPSPWTMALEVA